MVVLAGATGAKSDSASGDEIGQPASHYGAQAVIGETGCGIGT